jgi:hypothetical protein
MRDGLRTTTIERTLLDLAGIGVNISQLAHEATAKKLTTKPQRRPGPQEGRRRTPHPWTTRAPVPALPRCPPTTPAARQPPGRPLHRRLPLPERNLVIETDEDAHQSQWVSEADRCRDRYLAAHGYE